MLNRVWLTPYLDTPPACLTPEDLVFEGDQDATVQQQAKHYDALLRKHGPLPWILVRLGCCHEAMHSPATSLVLFRQCLSELRKLGVLDPEFAAHIQESQAEFDKTAQSSLAASKRLKYYQKWKSTREYRFPLYIPHMPAEHESIKDDWMTHFSENSPLRTRYMTSLAIETQHVENTFLLTPESTCDLVRRGITEGTVDTLPESEIHDSETIKNILNDTLTAFHLIDEVVSDPAKLTPAVVKAIHTRLMETFRFCGSAYTPPAETRTTTKKTIVIQGACNIECCPYPEVDAELDYICKMAKQYSRTWRNPFGTASWIHLILIRCQPFSDGNGRITRIVASLPLLVHGYPPMTVLPPQRPDYHEALRKASNGEHRPLIECIVKGIETTMKAVREI